MKISAAFPSKYLKAADLQDREIKLSIAKVEMENIGDDDRKPVVYFHKTNKGLCLNKTNAKAIATAYGDNTDEWDGKPIILFPMMVQFRDEMVESIRVKVPKDKPTSTPQPAPAPQPAAPSASVSENPAEGLDDEIPF